MRRIMAAVLVSSLLAVKYGAPVESVVLGAGVACLWCVWNERGRVSSNG